MTRRYESCYVEGLVCSKCDWFSAPLLDFTNGINIPVLVCPVCGEATMMATGKYQIKEEYSFFGLILKSRNYLSFEKVIS
jgi:hypothetical protein